MSDYETTQKRRNITVGIFVVAGLCAVVWLIFKFGDLPIKVSKMHSFTVIVQFPKADGVQENTPVRFCGYQIGRVTDVMAPELLYDENTNLEYYQTKVILSIDNKYSSIPSNVDVKLMTRGLGSSYIELIQKPGKPLEPKDPNRPGTEFLVDGLPLQGSTGMASEFFPPESQEKLEQLVESLRVFVNNANDLIGDKSNKENFKLILANLSDATGQATDTLKEVQDFSAAGTTLLKNADAKMDKLVLSMIEASEELSQTVAQLRIMLGTINSGQGTAAKLVNDGRLYESLLENSEQLQILMAELKSLIGQVKEKGLRSIY